MRCARPTKGRSAVSSKGEPTCCSSRRSSTRSTSRPASSRSRTCSRETGVRLPVCFRSPITGPERSDAVGPDARGVLRLASGTRIRSAVGINCALGARDMRPYLADLARIAECYVSCYPNAGLPNEFGAVRRSPPRPRGWFASSPQRLGEHRRRLLRHDARAHRRDRRRRAGRSRPGRHTVRGSGIRNRRFNGSAYRPGSGYSSPASSPSSFVPTAIS